MIQTYDIIVIGGGYRSILGAYCAARQGRKTALLERGPSLGGFMSPIKWGEFYIDKGPQFFDNFERGDMELMSEMLDGDIMEDIGFTYASYRDGTLTRDFALPDWRNLGADKAARILSDLLALRVKNPSPNFDNFGDLISFDGGSILEEPLRQMCRKFLRAEPETLSLRTQTLITFLGRKVLFDNETSMNLKKSPLLDGFLAAQKVSIGEERFNLYPKGSSLETVRLAMVEGLKRVGVDIVTNAEINTDDLASGTLAVNGDTYAFGELFMGTDVRDSEAFLFGTTNVLEHTHALPEIFHCYVVPQTSIDEAFYTVDYDDTHFGARLTNFSNYMGCVDKDGFGVFCVEEPIEKKWPALGQARHKSSCDF